MSARPPRAAPASSGVVRQLLMLQPYHYAYLGGVLVLTLGGLCISLIWGTHIQNLATTFPPVPQKDKSYWANKYNVFNQVFVKYAMVWNWLVFFVQLVALKTISVSFFTASPVSSPAGTASTVEDIPLEASSGSTSTSLPPTQAETASKKDDDAPAQAGVTSASLLSMSLIRFIAVTIIWLLFASWFFGPSIMYRILVATGGTCVPVQPKDMVGTLSFLPATVDQSYCAQHKAFTVPPGDGAAGLVHHKLRTEWRGGHDVSGHTFLLILSLLWMLEEVSPLVPYLLPWLQGLYPRSQWWPFNYRDPGARALTTLPPPRARGYTVGLTATLGLAGLWAWMLLLTQIYYHTPAEKLSGLVAGIAAWLLMPKGA